jgi:hypothetical protein
MCTKPWAGIMASALTSKTVGVRRRNDYKEIGGAGIDMLYARKCTQQDETAQGGYGDYDVTNPCFFFSNLD